MNTSEEREEQKLNSLKKKKILLYSGLALAGLELIVSVIFMIIMGRLRIIPKDYVVMIDILLVLICIVVVIAQRWVVAGIVTKAISLILTIVLVVGCIYLNVTYKVFKKTTNVNYKTTTVNVYVLADRNIESIEEIKNETFGIISELDRVNTNETITEIQTQMRMTIKTAEYSDSQTLAKALYDGEVGAIILNESYVSIVESADEFADFSRKTKKISSYKKSEQLEDKTKDETKDDNIITIYVSGVDLEGEPTLNQNSDVNILMIINKNTKQIMLLNTPRDYYVPLSISNGIPDKLTHAGCFGVDVSVGTLELLYGINIDYYIKMNFTGFQSIIDALGGVDVYSEKTFVTAHYKVPIYEGMNHLNGIQALGFARERYAFGSDIYRGNNQMKIITAMIKKMGSSDMLKNYRDVMNSIAACLVTDMSMDDIGDIVDFQLKENVDWDIVQYAVAGAGASMAGFSYSQPNYVMIPDENFVTMAKNYLAQIYSNEFIVMNAQ